MKKIHCIHCNHINDENEMICSKCHKTLYELDKYYTDMLKDHLTGKAKDSVTNFLLQLIKENLYGIVMTITVISTVATNVIIRSDNPKVITQKESTNQIVSHNDGIKSNSQFEALKVLGKAIYEENYDLLNKSSYLYNFNDLSSKEIKQLTNYGVTLEDVINKHKNQHIYIQIAYYGDIRLNKPNEDYIDINNHALYPLISESNYANNKVNIPNFEDIASYELEVFTYNQEPYIYSNLDTFYRMTAFYIKVNGSWYYLYSSTADKRVIDTRSGSLTYIDGDFVELLS